MKDCLAWELPGAGPSWQGSAGWVGVGWQGWAGVLMMDEAGRTGQAEAIGRVAEPPLKLGRGHSGSASPHSHMILDQNSFFLHWLGNQVV